MNDPIHRTEPPQSGNRLKDDLAGSDRQVTARMPLADVRSDPHTKRQRGAHGIESHQLPDVHVEFKPPPKLNGVGRSIPGDHPPVACQIS